MLGWAIDLNRDTCVVSYGVIEPSTPKRLEDVSAYKFGFDVSAFKFGDVFAAKKDNAGHLPETKEE